VKRGTQQGARIAELEVALKQLHDAACDVPVMRVTESQRELVKKCSDAIDVARVALGYPRTLSAAEIKSMMKKAAPGSAVLNQRGRRRSTGIKVQP
jgi:hypothetical protein